MTEKYAKWISHDLSCVMKDIKTVNANIIGNYDVIIHGGGLYAGGLSGLNRLKQWFPIIEGKHIILFSCGLADPDDAENVIHIENSLKKVLYPEMKNVIKQYHFRGGIDYSRLNFVHRSMMSMLCHTMKKKGYENLRDEDKLMIDTYGKAVDFSDRTTIAPLIEYVNSLSDM